MSEDTKKIIVISLSLALICAVSGIVLSITNAITSEQIIRNSQKNYEQALVTLVSGGSVKEDKIIIPGLHIITTKSQSSKSDVVIGEEISVNDGNIISYNTSTVDDSLAGYLVSIMTKGYGGDMKILCYYALDGSVINAQLLDNSETPGIGKNAEDSSYMIKFKNKGSDEEVPVSKDMLSNSDSDAISGATITFVAVANAIKNGSDFIKQEFPVVLQDEVLESENQENDEVL